MAEENPLQEIYQMILVGKRKQAMKALKPILAADASNSNALWLLANATDNLDQVWKTLDSLLRINPNHRPAINAQKALLPRMDPGAWQQMNEAEQMIAAEDITGAIKIVEPLTQKYPQNPRVWWVFANCSPDEQAILRALETVLRLDPNYPAARETYNAFKEQVMGSGGAFF